MTPRKILLALVVSSLLGCAPSAQEIKHLGMLSQAARAACAAPGQCPTAVSCIRAVLDATRPGSASRASYRAALSACDGFAGEVLP